MIQFQVAQSIIMPQMLSSCNTTGETNEHTGITAKLTLNEPLLQGSFA